MIRRSCEFRIHGSPARGVFTFSGSKIAEYPLPDYEDGDRITVWDGEKRIDIDPKKVYSVDLVINHSMVAILSGTIAEKVL